MKSVFLLTVKALWVLEMLPSQDTVSAKIKAINKAIAAACLVTLGYAFQQQRKGELCYWQGGLTMTY